jgi:hypothetical protein
MGQERDVCLAIIRVVDRTKGTGGNVAIPVMDRGHGYREASRLAGDWRGLVGRGAGGVGCTWRGQNNFAIVYIVEICRGYGGEEIRIGLRLLEVDEVVDVLGEGVDTRRA